MSKYQYHTTKKGYQMYGLIGLILTAIGIVMIVTKGNFSFSQKTREVVEKDVLRGKNLDELSAKNRPLAEFLSWPAAAIGVIMLTPSTSTGEDLFLSLIVLAVFYGPRLVGGSKTESAAVVDDENDVASDATPAE